MCVLIVVYAPRKNPKVLSGYKHKKLVFILYNREPLIIHKYHPSTQKQPFPFTNDSKHQYLFPSHRYVYISTLIILHEPI